jgi:hypothetical protein
MEIPSAELKWWSGSSKDQAIVRSQDLATIGCKDPKFDQYVCLSYSSLRTFVETYTLGCKEWR